MSYHNSGKLFPLINKSVLMFSVCY